MENPSNLPIAYDPKMASRANASDNVKRALKIMGGVGIGMVGIVAGAASSVITVPALAAAVNGVGFATFVAGASSSAINAVCRREKDLMFEARKKLDGRYYLFQKVDSLKYVKDLHPYDIAGVMTLNTIVGLGRYQGVLQNSKMIEENGKKVYKQGFATKTHSINIKNFELLAQLGYISIDSVEDRGTSKLIVEKLTVGNNTEKKKQEIPMSLIKFKLTDKKINLVDFYLAYKTGKFRVPGEKRIGTVLFNEKHGILRPDNPKGLSIVYDKFGRETIEYNSANPGIGEIKNHPAVAMLESQKDTAEFKDRIFIDEKEQAEADIQNRLMAEKMQARTQQQAQPTKQTEQPIQGLDNTNIER